MSLMPLNCALKHGQRVHFTSYIPCGRSALWSTLVNLAETPGQPSGCLASWDRGWYGAPPPLPKPSVSSEGIVRDHLPQESIRQILLHLGLEVKQPLRKLCSFLVPGDGALGQGTQHLVCSP